MHLAAFATTFGVIFAVELPDKTFVATIVLATRYPHLPVWLGVSGAFLVQTAVAVLFGGLVTLAPHRLVLVLSAILFGIGAVVLWRQATRAAETEAEDEEEFARKVRQPATGLRAAGACFLVLFAAEWGDLSQLFTVAQVARFGEPLSVGLGAWLALALVTALGVLVGRTLTRYVSLTVIRRIGGTVCGALALVAAFEAVGAF